MELQQQDGDADYGRTRSHVFPPVHLTGNARLHQGDVYMAGTTKKYIYTYALLFLAVSWVSLWIPSQFSQYLGKPLPVKGVYVAVLVAKVPTNRYCPVARIPLAGET